MLIMLNRVDFNDKRNAVQWEEKEKREFITSMRALSPIERKTILTEMREMAGILKKGNSYFEEDFS